MSTVKLLSRVTRSSRSLLTRWLDLAAISVQSDVHHQAVTSVSLTKQFTTPACLPAYLRQPWSVRESLAAGDALDAALDAAALAGVKGARTERAEPFKKLSIYRLTLDIIFIFLV